MLGVEGSEVMEVTFTGGDGGEMTEETLAEVLNKLQEEGQLTGANHTIIIRQPDSDEIQMIQITNNEGELIVTRPSDEDIRMLQSSANASLLDSVNEQLLAAQDGEPVMMVDESGNLVEGLVQMPKGGLVHVSESKTENLVQLTDDTKGELLQSQRNDENKIAGNEVKTLEGTFQPQFIATSPVAFSSQGNMIDAAQFVANKNGIDHKLFQNLMEETLGDHVENLMSTSAQKEITQDISILKEIIPGTPNLENVTPETARSKQFASVVQNSPNKSGEPSSSRGVISIKVSTGVPRPLKKPSFFSDSNVFKISTTTGKERYDPPKFHKCEDCSINFVSKVAYMNHAENCPSKRRSRYLNTHRKDKSSHMSEKDAMYSCAFCDYIFLSRIMLMQHVKVCESAIMAKNNKQFKSNFGIKEKEGVEQESETQSFNIDTSKELEKYSKKSQKFLGPILLGSVFKCRDCFKIFNTEHLYNKHIVVCQNTPFATQRNLLDAKSLERAGVKRKANSTTSTGSVDSTIENEVDSKLNPYKRRNVGTRYNTSKLHMNFNKIFDGKSEDEILDILSNANPSLSKTINKRSTKTSSSNAKQDKNLKDKLKYQKIFQIAPYCGICGDKFKNNPELILHTQMQHSEEILNIRDSLEGKGDVPSMKCPLCKHHFLSSHLLVLHIVSVHGKELEDARNLLESENVHRICPFCYEDISTQDLFKEHLATEHLDIVVQNPQSPSPFMEPQFLTKGKTKSLEAKKIAKPVEKPQKVRCPECDLEVMDFYFDRHQCAAEKSKNLLKKFVCFDENCGLKFYKLAHLLSHLQQGHPEKTADENETFETHAKFLDWLRLEEIETEMKYTKSLQRMKEGKLISMWICHKFHNSMNDGKKNSKKYNVDRSTLCYSRICAITSFASWSGRYEGKTEISYYKEHNHSRSPTKITFSDTVKVNDKSTSINIPNNVLESPNNVILENSKELIPEVSKKIIPEISKNIVPENLQEAAEIFTGSNVAFSQNFNYVSTDSTEGRRTGDFRLLGSSQVGKTESFSTSQISANEKPKQERDNLREDTISKNHKRDNLTKNGPEIDKRDDLKNHGTTRVNKEDTIIAQIDKEDDSLAQIDKKDSLKEGTVQNCLSDAAEFKQLLEEDVLDVHSNNKSNVLLQQGTNDKLKNNSSIGNISDTVLLLEKILEGTCENKDQNWENKDKNWNRDGENGGYVDENRNSGRDSSDMQLSEVNNRDNQSEVGAVDSMESLKHNNLMENGKNSSNSIKSDQNVVNEYQNHLKTSQSTVEANQNSENSQEAKLNVLETDVNSVETSETTLEATDEENLYVLPANAEEWEKLFELVVTQLESQVLTSEGEKEAKELLLIRNEIFDLEIEKQIDVFTRLCVLTNVQVS